MKKIYWLMFLVPITLFSFYDLYCTFLEVREISWSLIIGKIIINLYILGSVIYLIYKKPK